MYPTFRKKGTKKQLAALAALALLTLLMVPHSTAPALAATGYQYDPSLSLTGSNYQDVPSSSSLQLKQFSVAAWFRTTMNIGSESAFIVNKGGLGSDQSGYNLNYGIWMDSQERIVAGFETTAGTNIFVNSPSSYNDGNWHYVVATFAGSNTALKLYIDDQLVASTTTSASPDNTGTQPVRIGANSFAVNQYFVGNIDEVRVWGRAITSTEVSNAFQQGTVDTTSQLLYRNFGTNSGGGTGQNVDISKLRGVNYDDLILSKTELGSRLSQMQGVDLSKWPSVQVSLKQMHDHGFNLVRVPFSWEGYNRDPQGVLNEMDAIASAADSLGMYVFFDHHQFGASTYFYGSPFYPGFPSYLLSKYTKNGGATAEKAFWTDYYNNAITFNGKSMWQLQAEVWQPIIAKVDKHPSVLGYEILNEPPIYDNTQYAKLGAMHTFIADKIRSYGASKYIIFDRAYPKSDSASVDWNYYPKIAPANTAHTIFGPHRYSQYYSGIFGNYQKLATQWGGIPVIVGEYAQTSQDAMNAYMAELKKVGFGSTYWEWSPRPSNYSDPNGQCLINYDYTPTKYLGYLTNAVKTYYP